ncbi:response regulator transcription factor [Corynebacterium freneyi]|uniref:DNA-binding NarL/FixJ family response regulator n=1 Tax=Corynebacterium freneyi TaxID=134034 RepID=A0ABS4U3V8_9CORY|nr:response regulator transcription factor [Corynebacterium freneyi]MBP2331341.1 DNA-binding NarL/FixJ family response regulator [Corynebacterium freneyi]QXA52164.1 response regulator transcription factor [Corynebacterium freneyi]UBI02420.1 response regulator transcription factor [Corynebacterium freneyi]WJZ04036.1 Oxygen regulatory protein NreC [Corynebacterium freneyi]
MTAATPARSPLRIVLAEDSPLLRAGVEAVLGRGGHEVVAAVGDGDALVAAVRATVPDLVITDVRMPPNHSDEGLRAAAQIRRERPTLPMIVLSQYVSVAYLDDLMAGGGRGLGYLLKDRVAHIRHFLNAVAEVATGQTIIDPEVVRALVGGAAASGPIATLTPREREVLSLMAEGRTNHAIAEELVVSEAAVRKHIGGIFSKLPLDDGADRRVSAVLAYLRSEGR